MQVQKKEIREKIIESAKIEFGNKGYNKASMRNISKLTGITVGNLYRYFKGKEVLFSEIVSPAYNRVLLVIDEFNYLSTNCKIHNTLHDLASKRILEIYYQYSTELLILINGSEGTTFESTVDELVVIIKNIMIKGLNHIKDEDEKVINPGDFILEIIAKGYLDGLSSILSSDLDNIRKEEKIRVYNRFVFRDFCDRFREE